MSYVRERPIVIPQINWIFKRAVLIWPLLIDHYVFGHVYAADVDALVVVGVGSRRCEGDGVGEAFWGVIFKSFQVSDWWHLDALIFDERHSWNEGRLATRMPALNLRFVLLFGVLLYLTMVGLQSCKTPIDLRTWIITFRQHVLPPILFVFVLKNNLIATIAAISRRHAPSRRINRGEESGAVGGRLYCLETIVWALELGAQRWEGLIWWFVEFLWIVWCFRKVLRWK